MTRTMVFIGVCLLGACEPGVSEDELQRQVFMARRAELAEVFSDCDRDANTRQAALVAEARCLEFRVAENPEAPDGRRIPLKIMVIPALRDNPAMDPLVLLAGGPGQAATTLTPVAALFARIRTERDIVLVDQRGTGELSPFDCEFTEDEPQLAGDLAQVLARQEALLRECLARIDADPAYYTTDIAMGDLDDIRRYLGYRSLNLWGGSYGTRAALAYLQAYPDSTRSVIIDGVAPTTLHLPVYFERDASASLQALFDDCAADAECHAAYPMPAQHLAEIRERLALAPEMITVTNADMSTDSIELSADVFMSLLRLPLYSREAQRVIPLIIEQAHGGNYQPLFALTAGFAEAGINQGMFLSVICSEDYSRIDADELDAARTGDILIRSDFLTTPVLEACKIWPKRALPAAYFEPVREDVPVLIFSGSGDPVTPPRWGAEVANWLPRSRHIVLPGFAHGTMNSRCTVGIMSDFIEAGSLDGLDEGCIGQFDRRLFFTSPGGFARPDDNGEEGESGAAGGVDD